VLNYTRLRNVAGRIENAPNCALLSESMPLRAARIDRLHRQVIENRTRVCLVEIPPWYLVSSELARWGDLSVTGDDAIFAIDKNRVHEIELPDRRRYLLNLLVRMGAGVLRIGLEILHLAIGDLEPECTRLHTWPEAAQENRQIRQAALQATQPHRDHVRQAHGLAPCRGAI